MPFHTVHGVLKARILKWFAIPFSSGGCVGRAKAQAAATGALSVDERSHPCPRSGAEAGRTPCLKAGGQEELPHVRGQGQRPRVPDCDGAGTAERSYPRTEVKKGGGEEIPLVQGKEQWLLFAGAAVKRYPTPKVRETQVRR